MLVLAFVSVFGCFGFFRSSINMMQRWVLYSTKTSRDFFAANGATAFNETGEENHGDVNEEGQNKKIGTEKMKRTSTLVTAEDVHKYGEDGRAGGRHGKAGDEPESRQVKLERGRCGSLPPGSFLSSERVSD